MTQLSVNVNKLATIRNARGKNNPDVVQMARDIILFGAHGITVHPRPDERHIRKSDVLALSEMIKEFDVEYNIEGYPSDDFLKLVESTCAHQCTLVPDPPEAITSNAGWNVIDNFDQLKKAIDRLQSRNIRASIFVDPTNWTSESTEALKKLMPERIELYTESFAENCESPEILNSYATLAKTCSQFGIGINAGHDLSLKNIKILVDHVRPLNEVSIGHALICEALYLGLETTVKNYLEILS